MFVFRNTRVVRRINNKTVNACFERLKSHYSNNFHRVSVLTPGIVNADVPHFDVEITERNVDSMARAVISQIKTSWDLSTLQRKDFKGGLSNKVVGYFYDDAASNENIESFERFGRSDIVILRIYGEKTDVIKNRQREVRNIRELSQHGFASPLYCTFSNGYCYEFLEGEVCSPEDLHCEDILRQTANCMAELHTVKLSDNYLKHHPLESTLFHDISYYLNAIPLRYSKNILQRRFENNISSVEMLRAEVETMFEVVSKLGDMNISYCHNDFHPINLVYDDHHQRMRCIDHERGAPNYSAFDIGNYFNEFAGVYKVDYNLYPDLDMQSWWLRLYLEKFTELNERNGVVSETDIDQLRTQVEYMSLASHLFWVSWALSLAASPVSKFDYMGYGIIRLNEYFRRKEEILSTYGNEFNLASSVRS